MKTPGMIATAIKGFNREWTAVTSIRSIPDQEIIGWRFQAACGTDRKFPNQYWDDAHGAAVQAMESHRCNQQYKMSLTPQIKERLSQNAG